jgi:excinuclease ABC subunit C
MAIHELKEQIARLPEQPGVYLYFNADGDTIYVGKARALRDRVRNYLGAYGSDPRSSASTSSSPTRSWRRWRSRTT